MSQKKYDECDGCVYWRDVYVSGKGAKSAATIFWTPGSAWSASVTCASQRKRASTSEGLTPSTFPSHSVDIDKNRKVCF